MGDALTGILKSKKFIFAIIAMAVLALEKKLGLELDMKTKAMFVAVAATAIGGTALQDIGKEKAKIEKNGG